MKNIIKELYYGNIDPQARGFKNGSYLKKQINLIEQNVSIVNVASWLGHSSPTTTLNFYAHTNQEQKKRVANVIDGMLAVR